METNGNIYISLNFKKSDFANLNLVLESSNEVWKKAVDIFNDRINGRFIEPITSLRYNASKNGFVIMAVDCLLIDTFYQFENGLDENSNNNKRNYCSFLYKNFQSLFATKEQAEEFYIKIRCGILHSAQTKSNGVLTIDRENPIEFQNDVLYVSVEKFTDCLMLYFYEYKQKLLNNENQKLRENFIKKMNFICNK